MSALMEREIAAETSLRFACGHCGVILSVPIALAGVRGPCPHCQHIIEAPGPPVRGPLKARPDTPAALPPGLEPLPSLPAPAARAAQEMPSALPAAAPLPRRTESEDTFAEEEEEEADFAEHETAPPVEDRPLRPWGLLGVGVVLGALGALGLGSVWGLKRDLSPAPGPAYASAAAPEAGEDEGALAALDELKREAARESKALLAAQDAVWRFFSEESAEEAMALLDAPPAEPLADASRRAALEKVTLRAKRRLPEEAGYATQWSVVTAQFGEVSVETTDSSGQARLRWSALAPQLQLGHTTATAQPGFQPELFKTGP